jgi:hypothetical protein
MVTDHFEPPYASRGLARPDLRKPIRRVRVAFLITLAVSAIGLVVIAEVAGSDAPVLRSLLLAFTPACFAASIACWTTVVPIPGGDRDIFGGDQQLQKAMTEAIMKRSSHGLDVAVDPAEKLPAPQRQLAARYAAIQSAAMPFHVAQGVFALVAVLFLATSNLVGPPTEFNTAYLFTLVFGAVSIAVILPIAVRRWRSFKQYRDTHQHDLVDAS